MRVEPVQVEEPKTQLRQPPRAYTHGSERYSSRLLDTVITNLQPLSNFGTQHQKCDPSHTIAAQPAITRTLVHLGIEKVFWDSEMIMHCRKPV